MANTYDLGAVTSYAIAVEHGYEGTEAQFAEELTGATAAARAAAEDASDAEAYAVGKRGGVDVGSTDPAYHNNAKYWAENASGTNLAQAFSTSTAYAVGDYVLYSNKLYRFTTAHSAGAWNSAQVSEVKTMDEVSSIKGDLSEVSYDLMADKLLPRNADFNDYINPGVYLCSADSAYINSPLEGGNIGGILEVYAYPTTDLLLQFIKSTGGVLYIRQKPGSGVWTNWYKVSNEDSVKYSEQNKSDEQKVVALNNIGAFGYGATAKYIVAGSDFDTYTETGVYQVYVNNTIPHVNAPVNEIGVLIVVDGNYVFSDTNIKEHYFQEQIYITLSGNMFYRYRLPYNTTLSEWRSWTSSTNMAVKYTEQSRTSEEKAIALNNIGAFGYGSKISYTGYGEDFDDYIKSGIYQVYYNSNTPTLNIPTGTAGTLIVTHGDYTQGSTQYSDYYFQQIFIASNGTVYYRHKINKNAESQWSEWYSHKEKTIRILFIGNSLTQDGVSYLAYMLKNYYPEISFVFYIWYNGGYTLQRNYEAFTSDTACSVFSTAINTESWTNQNNTVKMSEILTTKRFDIVCMQPYVSFVEVADEITGWNNCANYIKSNYTGGNSLKFVSMFHAPRRDRVDSDIAKCKEIAQRLLNETICEDVIPMGLAVYDALSTDLDSLGDQGHLSPDGTHTQEGLPCLLQTYVVAQWIFDKLAIPKSVYLHTLRMTTEIYTTINVPGPNLGSGVITGTDAQNILAQEVAIKAYKKGKALVTSALLDMISN